MISQGKYSQIKVADYSSKEVFVVTPNDTMNYARKISRSIDPS